MTRPSRTALRRSSDPPPQQQQQQQQPQLYVRSLQQESNSDNVFQHGEGNNDTKNDSSNKNNDEEYSMAISDIPTFANGSPKPSITSRFTSFVASDAPVLVIVLSVLVAALIVLVSGLFVYKRHKRLLQEKDKITRVSWSTQLSLSQDDENEKANDNFNGQLQIAECEPRPVRRSFSLTRSLSGYFQRGQRSSNITRSNSTMSRSISSSGPRGNRGGGGNRCGGNGGGGGGGGNGHDNDYLMNPCPLSYNNRNSHGNNGTISGLLNGFATAMDYYCSACCGLPHGDGANSSSNTANHRQQQQQLQDDDGGTGEHPLADDISAVEEEDNEEDESAATGPKLRAAAAGGGASSTAGASTILNDLQQNEVGVYGNNNNSGGGDVESSLQDWKRRNSDKQEKKKKKKKKKSASWNLMEDYKHLEL